MAIFRVEKNDNYTHMSNYHLRDKNLSYKAKGLLSFMLSLPDDWDYSIAGLASVSKEEETAIKSILNELKNAGYLEIAKERNKTGKFEYIYNVFERPHIEEPEVEKPEVDEPEVEKPEVDEPEVEAPKVENQGQINTNKQITKKQYKKINKKEENNYLENFNKFWKEYPKKQKKKKVIDWFKKNKPDEQLMKIILEKLGLFKKTEDWQKNNGQFIPLPTTWLNDRRWEDETTNIKVEAEKKDYGGYEILV